MTPISPPLNPKKPKISTSIYKTHLGLTSLSYSHSLFGISLDVSLPLNPPFRFKIHPWLYWKRKGNRRFRLKTALQNHSIRISWNLTRARFSGSPEPSSSFFIAVSFNGEILLVAGDMRDEARRKMKAKQGVSTTLVSRREEVALKGVGSYRTAARIWGADREIGIEIDGAMSILVDGKRVLQVRRVRWKFRGSQRVEIGDDCGGRVLISWDLHTWFFPFKENKSFASSAIFVLCFESGEKERGICCEKEMGDWSESSLEIVEGRNENKKKRRSLLKNCSSSSSSFSSVSSAASSTVVDWWSSEEAEMRGVDGFTLVVYAAKK